MCGPTRLQGCLPPRALRQRRSGLFGELGGTVDGLSLGRRAHDPAGFAAVPDQIDPARAAP
ncbi:MAG: hypothetical protein M3130_10020 [Actinomycetota bacterium]|nr:hypothetical protein [Actinomycetota bacterium]